MRIDDQTLRKLALALALAGILLLFILSHTFKPAEVRAGEIDNSFISRAVLTRGVVRSRHLAKNTLIFEIADGGSINAVLFSPTSQQLDIVRKGSLVEAEGVVEKYLGELEIVVEKVRRID